MTSLNRTTQLCVVIDVGRKRLLKKHTSSAMLGLSSRNDYFGINSIFRDESEVEVKMLHSVFLLAEHVRSKAPAKTNSGLIGIEAGDAGSSARAGVRSREASSRLGGAQTGSPRAPNVGSDVVRGASLSLALWNARLLYQVGVATIVTPALFSVESLNDFKADAALPSLPERSSFMIELGADVAPYLSAAEAARIRGSVLRLFLSRFPHVLSVAHAKGHDMRAARLKLGASEQVRLDIALKDIRDRKAWRSGASLGGQSS